jgi:branched-chain amino acid transport system substrate-binding protein
VALASALILAACGSGATDEASNSGGGSVGKKAGGNALDFVSFVPFSGADASFGQLPLASCDAALYYINRGNGVMGRHFACTTSDTRGDPVDAVPAANALIAHTEGIAAIFGPSSDGAKATVSILTKAHVPTFLMTGLTQFDKPSSPYVWRLTPSDSAEGGAMAAWAWHKGYRKAAAVFSTQQTSIGTRKAAINGFKRLGGKIVADVTLATGQPSYSSQVRQVVAAHPQVIFYTGPVSTSATFFSALKQQTGGAIPPTMVPEISEEPNWVNAVGKAVGPLSSFTAVEPKAPAASAPGAKIFRHALLKAPKMVKNAKQYTGDQFVLTYYDACNLIALAMLETKSTDPQTYNGAILDLMTPGSGKTVVHGFTKGKKELLAGHKIVYEGAEGTYNIDKYHNVTGAWSALTESTNPASKGVVPPKLLEKAVS